MVFRGFTFNLSLIYIYIMCEKRNAFIYYVHIILLVCAMFEATIFVYSRNCVVGGLIMELSLIVVKCRISFNHIHTEKVLILKGNRACICIRVCSST